MGWTRYAGAATWAVGGAPYEVTNRVRDVPMTMLMMMQKGEEGGGGRNARHRLFKTRTQHRMVGEKTCARERERGIFI